MNHLCADYVFIVSLSSVGTKQVSINAYDVKRTIQDTTLRFTYKILDGQTGASLTAEADKVVYSSSQTVNRSETSSDIANDLIDEAATKIAQSLKAKVNLNRISEISATPSLVNVKILIEAADLVIPDVRIDKNNTIAISETKYAVQPLSAEIEVDGVSVGSAPSVIQLRPGFSKIRITRSGFATWEKTINASNGLNLTVALVMNAEGYSRWKNATQFLNELKNGAILTDAEAAVLRGKAKMLEQTGYRVDTKQAPATNIFFK